ncbi:hypothetical protein DFJ73DRAFT_847292 [Zopfochytrium polystomum]|nr:hypothetical protein DFJ73DRAFT_847292 [Zopfochytrium polystomum]
MSAPEKVAAARSALLDSLSRNLSGLDPDRTALLLSGGLDTAIIAGLAPLVGFPFKHAITVSCTPDEGQPHHDLPYAKAVVAHAGIPNHTVLTVTDPLTELFDPVAGPIRTGIASLQCFDPMELRGGSVVVKALSHLVANGFTAVVTGDAADELFAGYSFLHRLPPAQIIEWTRRTAANMSFSAVPLAAAVSLAPDPAAAKPAQLRVVQPFVDPAVVEFALTCDVADLLGPDPEEAGLVHGKLVLRVAVPEAGPSRWRRKVPLETGSGVTPVGDAFAAAWNETSGEMGKGDDASKSPAALAAARRRVFDEDGIVIRDAEHLHYYNIFRAIFAEEEFTSRADGMDGDEDRRGEGRPVLEDAALWRAHQGTSRVAWKCKALRFSTDPCIRCGFQLERPDQFFCKTCGAWPARENGPPTT